MITLIYVLFPVATSVPVCDPNCATCQGSSCQTCAANAWKDTSTCVCNVGLFPNLDAMNCSSCDLTCSTCTSPANSACTACYSGGSLAGGYCSCLPGYTPTPDARLCVPICDVTCSACSAPGSTFCTSCYSNGYLTPLLAPIGSCVCTAISFVQNAVTGQCDPCDLSCKTCAGTGSGDCTACWSDAGNGGGTGACTCNVMFFPVPDARLCSPCEASCYECNAYGATLCTNCFTFAQPLGAYPTSCVCDPGRYPDTDASSCSLCDTLCVLCVAAGPSGCKTCFSDSHLNSGTVPDFCVCDDGFWPNADVTNCNLCISPCVTCSGGTTSDCNSCPSLATLSGPAPSSCVCVPGYYPATDASNCQLCDPTCTTCLLAGPSQCTGCKTGAALAGTAPSACQCVSPLLPMPDAANCSPCHVTCFTCSNLLDTGCLSCKSFAGLSLAGTCACEESAYTTSNSANCVPCSNTCLKCIADGTDKCTACKPGAELASASPSSCVCSVGFFPNVDASLCSPCDPTCLTCSSFSTCTSCKPHAELQDTECYCSTGFYPLLTAANCVQCASGCAECILTGCKKCLNGWVLDTGLCFPASPPAPPHPIPSLSILANNSLLVSFDQSMDIFLSKSDIFLGVNDTEGADYNITWSNPLTLSATNITINLTIVTGKLPADSQVWLTFLTPAQVVGKDTRLPIEIVNLNGTLHELLGNVSQGSFSSITQLFVSAGLTVSFASFMLSGTSSFFWRLFNNLEILCYIPLTRLDIHPSLKETLISLYLEVGFLNPITPMYSYNLGPPDYAHSLSLIDSALFLNNLGFELVVITGLLSLIPLLTWLSHCSKLTKLALALKSLLYWGLILRLSLSVYLQVCLFTLMQLTCVPSLSSFGNAVLSINAVIACISLLCAAVAPGLALRFLLQHRVTITSRKDARFNRKWGELFLEFKADSQVSSLVYYVIFLLRRLSYAFAIILLPDYKSVQAVLNTALSAMVLATQVLIHIVLCRPYVGRLEQLSSSLEELAITLVFIISSSYLADMTAAAQETLAMIGIATIYSAIVVNAGFATIKCGDQLKEIVTEYIRRAKDRKQKSTYVMSVRADETNEFVTKVRHGPTILIKTPLAFI